MEATILGGCQNYDPFWGTLSIRCRIIIGIQKGTIILTTAHIHHHDTTNHTSIDNNENHSNISNMNSNSTSKNGNNSSGRLALNVHLSVRAMDAMALGLICCHCSWS